MITKYNQYIKENTSTNQFFKTYEETKKWLDEMMIKNYTINEDLTVDVDGDVHLYEKRLNKILVQFGTIYGDFLIGDNNLTTLDGNPKEVYGSYSCSSNKITTFIGLPIYIKKYLYCYNNQLKSLDGLSIYNLKNNIDSNWFIVLSTQIKEDYFDNHLKENPEIINLINFET